MADDLVKRLREYRVGCGLHCEAHDAQEPLSECIEAADRIEKLDAALKTAIHHCEDGYSSFSDIRDTARKALEVKNG